MMQPADRAEVAESPPAPLPEKSPAPPPRAVRRVVMLSAGAFLLYGSWAALANVSLGINAATRAGLAQGTSSAIVTASAASGIEAMFRLLGASRGTAILSTLLAGLCAAALHVTLHLIAGTPRIIAAALPSFVMGFVASSLYSLMLLRASRPASPAA